LRFAGLEFEKPENLAKNKIDWSVRWLEWFRWKYGNGMAQPTIAFLAGNLSQLKMGFA
jgi:hypothetical protein